MSRVIVILLLAFFICCSCQEKASNPNKELTISAFIGLSEDKYRVDPHKIRRYITDLCEKDETTWSVDRQTRGYYLEGNPFIWINRFGVYSRADTLVSSLILAGRYGLGSKMLRTSIIEDDIRRMHDLDIDVAMFRDNRPDNLVELMAKRGFKRSRYIIVGDGQDGFEETYTCQEVSIDIFYFHKVEEKDEVYCYDFISDPQLHARDSMKKYGGLLARRIYLPFTGVSDFEFLGHQVKVPLNYDEYLSAHYGKDYMIPNPAWSTLTSPVARIIEGEIGKLVQFE